MLIIKSQDYLQNADQHRFLSNVQKLAGQISCNGSNMKYVEGASDVMRLPIPLTPECAEELDNLLHSDENIVRISLQIQHANTYLIEASQSTQTGS